MVDAGIRLTALAAMLVASLLGGVAATAAAAPNPAQNIPIGALPSSCSQSPLSAACENGVVAYLDSARKDMSLSSYYLPPGFTSLSPDRQLLILSNLDRLAYGLPPVAGLNDALGTSASEGVEDDSDPRPDESTLGEPIYGWTSNWAGGFANVLAAYYDWMYDDGYGSPNGDCTEPSAPGCWGHRQDVLASFGPDGFVSMGAAAGHDGGGWAGYAQLLVFTTKQPTYYYTWTDALGEGADKAPSEPERETKPPGEHEHKTESPPEHESESHSPGEQKASETPPSGGQKEPEAKTPGDGSGSTACTSGCSTSGSTACAISCSGSGSAGPSPSLTTGLASDVGAPQIATSLAGQLAPRGATARIAAMLRWGGYVFAFSSPTAGVATIGWYAAPRNRKRAVAATALRRLIASGRVTFTAAGTATITLELTAQGRRLLAHRKRLKLTAVGTFSPSGAAPVSVTKTFVLGR